MSAKVVIDFLSTPCRSEKHSECDYSWTGLDFQFDCNCPCHEKTNNAADGFGSPDSAASSHYALEVTKDND